MKIPKVKSKEKEDFASALFKKGLGGAAVNRKVGETFGSPLRVNTLYRLRRQALASQTLTE